MSQSPLSRAIRELERELGVTLFVRTTRRVELTEAGSVLLERSRRALAEIDGAIADVQRSAQPDAAELNIGYGPFSQTVVSRVADVRECGRRPALTVRRRPGRHTRVAETGRGARTLGRGRDGNARRPRAATA